MFLQSCNQVLRGAGESTSHRSTVDPRPPAPCGLVRAGPTSAAALLAGPRAAASAGSLVPEKHAEACPVPGGGPGSRGAAVFLPVKGKS